MSIRDPLIQDAEKIVERLSNAFMKQSPMAQAQICLSAARMLQQLITEVRYLEANKGP